MEPSLGERPERKQRRKQRQEKWKFERKRERQSLSVNAAWTFWQWSKRMPVADFMRLLQCGKHSPSMYVFLHQKREAWRPDAGIIPWPIEFICCMFHRKHDFHIKKYFSLVLWQSHSRLGAEASLANWAKKYRGQPVPFPTGAPQPSG